MDKRTLCAACENCPEVVLEGDSIRIGQIVVPKAAWNGLGDAIKTGRSLSARMRQPGLEFSERRLVRDWPERFGHPLLLLETFVEPARFRGTIYRAANWLALGQTRGYRRTRPLTPVCHDVNV